MERFNGVKVFTATKAKEREELGAIVTQWLQRNPQLRIVESRILQSSDSEFHCLTMVFFYSDESA